MLTITTNTVPGHLKSTIAQKHTGQSPVTMVNEDNDEVSLEIRIAQMQLINGRSENVCGVV